MPDIDIGEAAINRATNSGKATLVAKGNPANASGVLISVEIWAYSEMSNVEVATFFVVSGDNLSTRDYESIGTVTAGSKQPFDINLDVEEGDYIGINYFSGGTIETDTTEGAGVWRYYGDGIPSTDRTFDPNVLANCSISLYATSVAPTVGKKKNVIFMGSNF